MKILIIGLGSIGKKHVKALNSLELQSDIYAFRSSKTGENLAGVKNIYSWEDIDASFELAIISNPTSLHAEVIEKLLPFNIPLFIEKPVLLSPEKGYSLLYEVEHRKIFSYVACNLRFLDSLIFIKEKLTSSPHKINEVNAYCGSYLPDWRPEKDFRKIYSAIPELGGGVHLDLIHELDYLYWIFGRPNESYSYLSNKSHLDIAAIDYANYRLMYDDFLAQLTLNYFRKSSKRNLEILTDKGTYEVNLLANTVYFESECIFKSEQTIKDTYALQLQYVYECIANKTSSFNNLRNGLEVLEICVNQKKHDSFA